MVETITATLETECDPKWTRKSTPLRPVAEEVEHRAVCRGLEIKVTRYRYGSVNAVVSGYIGARRAIALCWPDAKLSDDDLRADVLAFARDLADRGMTAGAAS